MLFLVLLFVFDRCDDIDHIAARFNVVGREDVAAVVVVGDDEDGAAVVVDDDNDDDDDDDDGCIGRVYIGCICCTGRGSDI